ncbi:MAG: nucleotide exchange factor GrpE [Spirochaetes bacterium]|nr:MAG: nucleotide exchange factor GrpE [Spirochaetota bacterium]
MSRKENKKDIADEELMEDKTEETPETAETAGDDASEPIDELVSLAEKNAELEDQIRRIIAESQNSRKRLVKQQQDVHKYRHQDILSDLAEVIDNFERAIESSADSRDFDTFHEGILMIEKQFSGMLTERYGLERIGVEGEAYDPFLHESMMSEESDEVEEEIVKQVYQAGYRLHDRVLRPAKVVVVKPAASESEDFEKTTETTETTDAADGDE